MTVHHILEQISLSPSWEEGRMEMLLVIPRAGSWTRAAGGEFFYHGIFSRSRETTIDCIPGWSKPCIPREALPAPCDTSASAHVVRAELSNQADPVKNHHLPAGWARFLNLCLNFLTCNNGDKTSSHRFHLWIPVLVQENLLEKAWHPYWFCICWLWC